jgi:ATP-dependent DNA helicase RecG
MHNTELIRVLGSLSSLASENEVVEFKEAKNDFDFNKLGRYFSAISNEANLKENNFGWLVFGIRDKYRF